MNKVAFYHRRLSLNTPREAPANSFIKIGLFLLSPIAGFIFALRHINTRSSYIVFYGMCLFFGITFTVDYTDTLDAVRYVDKFEQMGSFSSYDYLNRVEQYGSFYTYRKNTFFSDTVGFVVSRFTNNYHWFFLLISAIFAFFYLKALKFASNHRAFDYSLMSYILAFLFALSNPIFNINGVRFWTASWIAVYCFFEIFRNGNRRYLILLATTPFVHTSFFVCIIVVLLAMLARLKEKYLFVFFVFSFFIGNLAVEFVRAAGSTLPPALAILTEAYSAQEYIDFRSEIPIVHHAFRLLITISTGTWVYLLVRARKHTYLPEGDIRLFRFALIWAIFVNLAMPIPSFGSRFAYLLTPMLVYLSFSLFRKKSIYSVFIYFLPFCNALEIARAAKNILRVQDTKFIYSNLIVEFFNNITF